MNNPNVVETRGPPYIPSARKSIHNHNRCIFSDCAEMGRYGVNSRREVNPSGSSPLHDQGIDEVDNVMSKFARQTSPVPVRHRKNLRIERRNSLNASDPEYSDDDESESNLLAKSLPANLPSYYCSNDFVHQSLPSDFSKAQNSTSFSESRTQINNSNEYNRSEYSTSASFEEYAHENQNTQKSKKSGQQILFPIIFAICSIAVALYYNEFFNLTQEIHSNNNYDEVKFNNDMNNLGEKYKINDISILEEVQSGISTILKRNDTSSFIFVYDGNSAHFNILQFTNFIQDIATTVARYLRNETMSNQPTVLHSSELNMQSHSELMKKYQQEVTKTGVMLVKDLDRVPSSLAMAFHYFCDEYNPLVAKSAIFFTLNLANCSNYPDHKSTHNEVEKCLANIWDSVPKDNIKPLLARVVNVVIDVTNVK